MNRSDGMRNLVNSDGDRGKLLSPPQHEIHLWLTDYDQIDDASLHNIYRQILNEEERAQEPRFYFARDRRRYLVTRVLVRTVLSRYAPVLPNEWIFKTNAYGRPEIANNEASHLQLSFNISHTHSLIVLGVTHRRALGVDVENVKTREALLDIADRFFAQNEVVELMALPSHQQSYRFFEYWTLKESYIKARGMGLSLPLDKFGFYFPHERAMAIDIQAELDDQSTRWHFWQLQPMPEYLVAVCAERFDMRPPEILIRQVIPLQAEEILVANVLRNSQ